MTQQAQSPAERRALAILEGVRIIQAKAPRVTLIALDGNIYVGPTQEGVLSDEEASALKALRWTYDLEQGAWGFYTGH